jgi:hypothetical protein
MQHPVMLFPSVSEGLPGKASPSPAVPLTLAPGGKQKLASVLLP